MDDSSVTDSQRKRSQSPSYLTHQLAWEEWSAGGLSQSLWHVHVEQSWGKEGERGGERGGENKVAVGMVTLHGENIGKVIFPHPKDIRDLRL